MSFKGFVATVLMSGLAVSLSVGAQAAENTSGDDYYAARGMNLGGFTLFPTLSFDATFDDNVFAVQTGAIDDTYLTLTPRLELVSNWSRHELVLSAQSETRWFTQQSSEDSTEFSMGADGRLDVTYATSIHAEAIFSMLTEERGNTNALLGAAELTEYDQFSGAAELRHRFNQLGVAIGGGLTTFDYDDTPAVGGGVLDNDFRDRQETFGRAEVNYAISPDTRIFVSGTVNQREYDQQPPAVAVNRDSEGYEVNGGLRFDVTQLISGEFFVGYMEQDYTALMDADGMSYGADLDWELTQLTTVSLHASRTIEETSAAGASSYLASEVGVDVEHELLRNVILNGTVSFTNNEYEGIVRDEDVWRTGFGAAYLVNHYLSANAGVEFESRESTVVGQDFDRTKIHGGLALQF